MPSSWHNEDVSHAAPEPPRRRFFRRRPPATVIDLRETKSEQLPDDPASVVARLARLRDAGLITNAEFEAERRVLLGQDKHAP